MRRLAYLASGLALVIACNGPTAPATGSAIVFGRITSTSGIVVPGATAIVKLFSDTLRTSFGLLQCAGDTVATADQQLDATGNYRLEIAAPTTDRRVCVELTGDPHGLYSDIAIKRSYVGWLELRAVGNGPRDSLRADLKYTETP
jgi:hypothetical protein